MGLKEIQALKAQAGQPKQKKLYSIPKKSKKKLEQEKKDSVSGDTKMDFFFAAQRKKMKGKCLFCGGKTMKDNDQMFRFSVAHILPKKIFKSVALLDDNWIELCFYNNSCHSNFDAGKITWEFLKDSKEWDVIKEKLLNILPLVAEEERKNKLYSKLVSLVYGTPENNHTE